MRRLALLALGLLAAGPSRVLAVSTGPFSRTPAVGRRLDHPPACLAQVRARLRGVITTTEIPGREIRGKRLVLHRGGVTLVLDHAVFVAVMRAFLEEQGADRFPDEAALLRAITREAARADELDLERILTENSASPRRLDYQLATVVERGAFQLRPSAASAQAPAAGPGAILRLEFSEHCGPLCGSGGRVFVTPACQVLFEMEDWIS